MNRELLLAEWRRSVRSLAAAGLLARDAVRVVAPEDARQEVERADAFVARIRRYLLDNALTDTDLESGIGSS